MIGKILSHLLGNAEDDFGATKDTNAELMEFEEGGWVIVVPASTGMKTDVFELGCVARTAGGLLMASQPDPPGEPADRAPQHVCLPDETRDAGRTSPSEGRVQAGGGETASGGLGRPATLRRLAVQRARTRAERKQLSRAALHRQNLASMRSSPGERRRGSYERLRSH